VSTKRKAMIDPIAMLTAHQKVGQEDADKIALPLLMHFDAAHRGQGSEVSADMLTYHVICAQVLAAKSGNRPVYDMTVEAWNALVTACSRPVNVLSFTTREYQAIKALMAVYLRMLPEVKLGMMNYAAIRAKEALSKLDRVAA
jgi:hypothetical protein